MGNKKFLVPGWIPDLPDHRDKKYSSRALATLPGSVDMRNLPAMPPVYDQGQLGSCTANSIAGAIEFEQVKQGLKAFMPSRLFIYYNERAMEGTINSDSGAMIRDGFKVINNLGAPEEHFWPYHTSDSRWYTKPTAASYRFALRHKSSQYLSVNNLNLTDMKTCLAEGFPFVFGFSVYESFESDQVAQTGIVPMPASSEQNIGGHAVLCVGYDDSSKRFIVRNSWGANWGQKGYFTIPYDYLTNADLSDDFWTLRLLVANPPV